MLKAIELVNFQSHAHTRFELSSGVNVIFGPSDNGKSSIIRASRWNILNRPNSDEFRRHDTDITKVIIESDKAVIERRRADGKNDYKMGKKVFKALRSDVPGDIAEALNINEANIQSQHEVYFLVDKSPGQRSKTLNEVAGLDIMDKIRSKVNKDVREVNQKIKAANDYLVEAQSALLELSWVKKADFQLKKLEEYFNKIEVLKEKHFAVTSIINDIKEVKSKQKVLLSDVCVSKIRMLVKKRREIDQLKSEHARITGMVNQVREIYERLDSMTVIDVRELRKLKDKIDKERAKYYRVTELIEEIKLKKDQHMQIHFELQKTKNAIKAELKRLGKCPTCGRKM